MAIATATIHDTTVHIIGFELLREWSLRHIIGHMPTASRRQLAAAAVIASDSSGKTGVVTTGVDWNGEPRDRATMRNTGADTPTIGRPPR